MAAHNTATHFHFCFSETEEHFIGEKPNMLALVRRPSLHGYDACMIDWAKGALRRNRRQKYCKTSLSPFLGFSVES